MAGPDYSERRSGESDISFLERSVGQEPAIFRRQFLGEWAASPDSMTKLDVAARSNNWTFLGQPERWLRRYGHDAHTVRVYWDETSEKAVRASLTRLGYMVTMVTDETAAERALEWLRTVTED